MDAFQIFMLKELYIYTISIFYLFYIYTIVTVVAYDFIKKFKRLLNIIFPKCWCLVQHVFWCVGDDIYAVFPPQTSGSCRRPRVVGQIFRSDPALASDWLEVWTRVSLVSHSRDLVQLHLVERGPAFIVGGALVEQREIRERQRVSETGQLWREQRVVSFS